MERSRFGALISTGLLISYNIFKDDKDKIELITSQLLFSTFWKYKLGLVFQGFNTR